MRKRGTEQLWPGKRAKDIKEIQEEVGRKVDDQKAEAAAAIKKRDEEREGKILFQQGQEKNHLMPARVIAESNKAHIQNLAIQSNEKLFN